MLPKNMSHSRERISLEIGGKGREAAALGTSLMQLTCIGESAASIIII
jgi:hypothetical protein